MADTSSSSSTTTKTTLKAAAGTIEDVDTSLITVGAPVEGGCVYVAETATETLPTDATTAISTFSDFVSVGTISDNGMTISDSVSSTDYKDWGGNIVLSEITEKKSTVKFEFIEVNRPIVAKLKHGINNVEEGTDGSVSHIARKIGGDQVVSLVIDELESNGSKRRTVIPRAKVESLDDETHKKGSLLVFGATFSVLDNSGAAPMDIYRAVSA